MPTITKYRFWCSTCQEWTLFNTTDYDKCNICGNPAVDIKYGDIPEDKIKEQRERWSNNQHGLMDFLTPKNPLEGMFNEGW